MYALLEYIAGSASAASKKTKLNVCIYKEKHLVNMGRMRIYIVDRTYDD